jgi:molybdopterin molybdotransferase
MISVEAAKALVTQHSHLLPAIELTLSEAAGHVLAKNIYAKYDIPAFRQSSMDGYAFAFAEGLEKLKIKGEMAAGVASPLLIGTGEASRIFTGAPLPEGADTVIMQEKVTLEDDGLILQDSSLQKGVNTREKGSEIKAGELAMEKGSLLSPAAIGFLAGIGCTSITVYAMPRVSIIVTGNELQTPGQELRFGQVYESNSYSLSAALKKEGITAISVYESDDKLEILIAVLQKAMDTADVVLITGGVSVGDYDFVVEASVRCGVEQLFHKVKQKPGKPLYFGKKGDKLIFGLPGNPSSVLSCYYNYVLPALKMLSGKENSVKVLSAELEQAYHKPAGLTHFLKGMYQDGKVCPLKAQDSYRLSSFARANCLICLPEDQTAFQIHDHVTILRLPE